ncbi:MAG: hypothetical protein GTO71_07320 [Woeseiaceae bacterium]|nr:hypothetical protein [Woeseiaceae bacterium]NIP20905.1 hypothetical protein [Woeseiaceae bacterium]
MRCSQLTAFKVALAVSPGIAWPNDVTSAFSVGGLAFGAQYFYRDRQSNASGVLASIFAVKTVAKDFRAIGRIDRIMEPSPKGNNISYIPFDPTARATMYLAALELRVDDHFYVTPNTIVISYDRNDAGIRPSTDFHLRLTAFINFE